jgi:hypothetical protein
MLPRVQESESAKECEGMNPTFLNEFIMDFRIFRGRLQGLKFIRLKSFLFEESQF